MRIGRLRCLALLAILAGSAPLHGAELKDYGVEPTTEGMRAFLRKLNAATPSKEEVAALIAQLDADAYIERERATARLASMIGLDRKQLLEAREKASEEVKERLRIVLAVHSADRRHKLVVLAMYGIIEHEIVGVLPELAEATRGIAYESDELWNSMIIAFETTARMRDKKTLVTLTQSPRAIVRAGALRAYRELFGAKRAAADVLPGMADEHDPRVAFLVASSHEMAEQRACLADYVRLLKCNDFGVRRRSFRALQRLTGRDFGYSVSEDQEGREARWAEWDAWLATEGRKAELRFPGKSTPVQPVAADDAKMLFNGFDLSGWTEVAELVDVLDRIDFGIPGRKKEEPAPNWKAIDGILSGEKGSNALLKALFGAREEGYRLRLEWRFGDGGGAANVGVMADAEAHRHREGVYVELKPGASGTIALLDCKAADARDVPIRLGRIRGLKADKESDDSWNVLEIDVRGGDVNAWINGSLVNGIRGCSSSHDGIVLHVEKGHVDFRNLTMAKLK